MDQPAWGRSCARAVGKAEKLQRRVGWTSRRGVAVAPVPLGRLKSSTEGSALEPRPPPVHRPASVPASSPFYGAFVSLFLSVFFFFFFFFLFFFFRQEAQFLPNTRTLAVRPPRAWAS